jgi:hypothetical protein
LEIFDNLANHKYVTGNRNRDKGGSNGLYPIIRILQLHQVAINSGYARLLSFNKSDGRKLVGDVDNQHVCWVGTEPWATQIIVKKCLHTSKSTRGPQRGAKTELHGRVATPSNKNQDPAQKRNVGRDRETGKSVQQTADQYITQGRIAAVIKQRLSACDRAYIWHRRIVCEMTKKAACCRRGDALRRAYGLIRLGGPSRLAPAQQT